MVLRDIPKLRKSVLVQNADILLRHRVGQEGFEFMDWKFAKDLFKDIEGGFFMPRYNCEEDESVLQPVPYVLFFGHDRTIFSYLRSSDISNYGEARLFGNFSIGVGGHITPVDAPEYVRKCLEREALNEEVRINGAHSDPKFVGTMFSRLKPTDRVHFGLIYKIHVNGNVEPKEEALISGEMIPIHELKILEETETWARLLIPYLNQIYNI